jgi:putative intracellular protease/amidase
MTTPRRPHRALLVLTAAPADDANGNDPWSVFTTEGWTVDITCIGGGSPGPRIPGAPLRTPRLEQLGTQGQPGLDGADHDSTGSGRGDRDGADRDWADRDWADRDCADYDVVCFVDGRTTTWVSPRNPDLSRLMSRISEHGEIIAAVRPAAFDWLEEFSLRDR